MMGTSRAISTKRTWNFVEINVPYEEATQCRQQIIDRMAPLDTVMDLVRINDSQRIYISLLVKLTSGRKRPEHCYGLLVCCQG